MFIAAIRKDLKKEVRRKVFDILFVLRNKGYIRINTHYNYDRKILTFDLVAGSAIQEFIITNDKINIKHFQITKIGEPDKSVIFRFND